jgi:hypothetical protein
MKINMQYYGMCCNYIENIVLCIDLSYIIYCTVSHICCPSHINKRDG